MNIAEHPQGTLPGSVLVLGERVTEVAL